MERTQNAVVLIVEDDPPVRELLYDVLRDEGCDIMMAHDGALALRILESVHVDLISLDLDIPGLSGSEFLDIIRKRKLALPPIVVVTANAPVPRKVKSAVQAVVHKPFDIDEFIRVVVKLLKLPERPIDAGRMCRSRTSGRRSGTSESSGGTAFEVNAPPRRGALL